MNEHLEQASKLIEEHQKRVREGWETQMKDQNAIPPESYFNNSNEMCNFINKRYRKDRDEYLMTRIWPNPIFIHKDSTWTYYYYLQLSDPTINLNKYLDFDYLTNDFRGWTPSKILETMNKYGKDVLLDIMLYIKRSPGISFDEYYKQRENFFKTLNMTSVYKIVKDDRTTKKH